MSNFVWLRYPETGGIAQLPVEAAPDWRAMGWVDSAPPPPVNPVLAEYRAPGAQIVADLEPSVDETSTTESAPAGARSTKKES